MNFGNDPPADNGGGSRTPGEFLLSRQPSIYSLTFDEFQSTIGGLGKDYGSMNMDEFLKNVWSAEEIQTVGSSSGNNGQEGSNVPLQRQGSLTLPRTLSQKTVDEVWKDISKDEGGGGEGSSMPQRQQTLGEMTLEEFLVRAGVVREEFGKPSAGEFLGDLSSSANNNTGFGIGYQQMGLIGDRNQMIGQNLPLNVNGVRSSQPQQQLPQVFPKQPALGFSSQVPLTSGAAQLGSPGTRGVVDQGLVQNSALQGGTIGVVGLGAGHVGVSANSPGQLSSDGIGKSNGDTSSVSPMPYMFNSGMRGRRSSAAVDKVIERRQRRMIKNRESAARSRARKQAYTMELEAEVAKLKEENQELRKKQEELMEMQKNQALEILNVQNGTRKRLRRTQTGPW